MRTSALGRHAELVGELRGPRPRASVPRAAPRAADARAVPLGTAIGGARRLRGREGRARHRSSGLEPGPELQQLQRDVLAHDESLKAPTPPCGSPTTARARPRGDGRRLGDPHCARRRRRTRQRVRGAWRVTAGGGALLEIDSGSGAIERRIPAGRTPSAVAVGAGVRVARGRGRQDAPAHRADLQGRRDARDGRHAHRRDRRGGRGVGGERPSAPECTVRRARCDGYRAAGSGDGDGTWDGVPATGWRRAVEPRRQPRHDLRGCGVGHRAELPRRAPRRRDRKGHQRRRMPFPLR